MSEPRQLEQKPIVATPKPAMKAKNQKPEDFDYFASMFHKKP